MFFTPERIALLLCLVGGYLFGLIQTGYFIANGKNVDIKHLGSGNTGATNMWRVMGAPWGLLTLVCDVAKTILAVIIANLVIVNVLKYNIPYHAILLYTGLGVVLGHDFPAYLKFKGGKGIACSFAIIACFKEWQYVIAGVVIFFLVLLISRYVSLSSIVTMIIELVVFSVCTLMNITYIPNPWITDCNIIMAILVVLALITHIKNIIRLFVGNEMKFSFKRKDYSVEEDDEDDEEDYEDEEDENEVGEEEKPEEEAEPEEEKSEEEAEPEEEPAPEEEENSEEEAEPEEEKPEEAPEEEAEPEEEPEPEEEAEPEEENPLPRVTNIVMADWKTNDKE